MKERTQRIFARFLRVNTPLTFEDLSKEFHISERTLRNELALINDYLAENHYPAVTTSRGQGMKLVLPDQATRKLMAQVGDQTDKDYYRPDERFLALLLEIADTTRTTLLCEMERKLQVSKSTLDEDMRKLRQYLQQYGISVVSLTKQGIVLQGDERSIRSTLYEVINSMTDIDQVMRYENTDAASRFALDYLDQQVLQQLGRRYDELLKKSSAEANQLYRNQIILFVAAWVRRIQGGNTISDSTKTRAEMKEGPGRNFVDAICGDLSLYPSLNEIKYITFTIESFKPKDMNSSSDWVAAQLLAIQLIEHVEKVTEIPFSQEEEDLYEGLYKHINGLLSRAKNELQVFNPLKDTIKETYTAMYNAVACFSRRIEDYTKKTLSEDEIGFLTVYFSTSASRMSQEEQYMYQAVVICNHGISTGKLLAANLKKHFNIEIVAVLSSYELTFIDKLDVDLIFTTIPVEYPRKPILLLNPILMESDKKELKAFLNIHKDKRRAISNKLDATKLMQDVLSLITDSGGTITPEDYQQVEETFKRHHLKINTRELQPMLQDVLYDSNILLNQEGKDWKEVITKVALPLLNDEVIEERYIKAMIKSVEEFGPYIVVGKHLALAHARPEDGVNKLGISVMTLKEPVHFGHPDNDPVKIVFCLAAVNSHSHIKIMKSLVELIDDTDKLNKLFTAEDVKTFNEALHGEIH
ncbi:MULTISPECIES: PTS sugar transporter subunit IIA [unclassified Paenibacillus]|uniref:BglG family transcription antiterminator n=1 Tax=unclassified Paenibacillus TaxID=185978 RepID=UPI002405BE4B|nr:MULTISPECIES: PTS sugar transporter subunit IIA [unclassified Paenibacillus]MDF9840816.1 mannitol operon transcriptional antiterminator [Paenibacillus sp. PastF-2]MDF9847399.1 mannitol operon transcriptional antiterminator [Paenibacillus sp. PastM-2]MDF9854023.1 mannitol operon transcriptional antiterminator [Paenibacillus sp. PastF-1]MDH6479296.1 mannitol operon transcriptional antiterminator [Paenibacillus sp. PastH-2]MDH6506969.1 mannitol operon transcriptional antiterminator [Paenibacil